MKQSAHPFGERRRRVNRSDSPAFESMGLRPRMDFVRPDLAVASAGAISHLTTSVIIVAQNDGPFIEECIESLLVQSVRPDEIIVCERGSADDTAARIARYGSRVSSLPFRGMAGAEPSDAEALHRAVQHSTGDLVFLLNGHDRFKREKIESYLSVYVANPDAALIQAPMDKIDEQGRVIGLYVDRRKHVVEHLKETERRHDVDFYYPRSALAFSRPCLKSLLPLDLQDGATVAPEIRMALIAPYFGRVLTLPQSCTEWRRRSRSAKNGRSLPRKYHVQQTLMRAKVYNHFCRRHGLRGISPWQNSRFYLQLLRYSLPDLAYRLFGGKLRARFLGSRPSRS